MAALEVTCVVVSCDDCGRVAFDGDEYGEQAGEVHFGDVVEAYHAARQAGWWAERNRVVCGWCLAAAACAHLGHEWSSWTQVSGRWCGVAYVGRRRECDACQTPEYDPPLPHIGRAHHNCTKTQLHNRAPEEGEQR